MDAVQTTLHDINNLYNLTTSLATSINFNKMIVHTQEYIDAATSGTLLPHNLPVIDLQKMLKHMADTLPPALHLQISPEDTLHFYRYLCTHVLIENKQFCY